MTRNVDVSRIKRAVTIAGLVGQHYTLDNRNGRRLRTTLEHDSLIVNTEKNTYTWYSKNEHGDVIDWVGRHELGYNGNWSSSDPNQFKEAVTWLARHAGLPEPQFKTEDVQARARRLTKERLMALAADYYRQQFQASPEAQQYAAGRGFTEETIQRAGMGYSGGAPAELQTDRPNYSTGLLATIPAADHETAAELGLIRRSEKGRYYDAIPLGYLIYAHRQAGLVTYLTGRAIHTNDPKLKTRNLPGTKRVFWCTWAPIGGDLHIVEGQADALSLAQMGFNALALCGMNVADLDLDFVDLFSPIYYWADQDQAGQSGIETMATAAGPLLRLPPPPVYHIDKQPVKDLNDLLRMGASREMLLHWLSQAQTYLDRMIERIGLETGIERETQTARLFEALSRLDDFKLIRYRSVVCEKLGLSKPDFNSFLNLARGQNKDSGFKRGEQYDIIDGWTVVYQFNPKTGQLTPSPLANAAFTIEELVIYDNGSGDMRREYAISGKEETGKPLATCPVPTAEYEGMKWIYEHYPQIILSAGRSTKDQLREAIQHQSGRYPHRIIYEHTGWRNVDGRWVYLTSNGALGLPPKEDRMIEIEVDLRLGRSDTHMAGFTLPTEPKEPAEAIRASLAMWHLVEHYGVTISYWAAAWLAPLSPFLPADFGIWPYGKTGSFKSVFAALSQAHFGGYWAGRDGRLKLPSNFISTVNNISMNAFIAKDILLVVDDYAPGNTERERRERDEVASRLLRSLGNKAARGRMRDGRRFQADFPPRCLAMITAEDLPPGQSILARGIGVRVPALPPKGSPERTAIETRVSRAQESEAPLYSHAMAAFILWIQRHWGELEEKLPVAVVENHKRLTGTGHARLADAFAKLLTAVDTALYFAQDAGSITDSQARDRQAIARSALQQVMAEHSSHIEALDPVEIFQETLREQLDAREWYLNPKDAPEETPYDWRAHAWCSGWMDESFIYLLPKAVNRIIEIYTKSGVPFPISRTTLYNRLKEGGILVGVGTEFVGSVNTSPHVVKLLKTAIYAKDQAV